MAEGKETEMAVDGQSIYFYFDRKKKVPVLNDTNIAVARGIIYSLLGPSGCGKTTLLKCIIGQLKLQDGSLKVYGRIPGTKEFPIPGRGVGYMPQHLGLYLEMSIEEIIIYFGSLYGMNRHLINERLDFFVELLALPDKKRMIKHLSGGQQRRVSFIIALIHKPPLLILDEPTVGVDPLLRQNIWNHLVVLAKNEHLTIIITTHYTEEARQADIVGLMRNGHVIVEKNPEDLMKHHQMLTLEDVFLKLCQQIGVNQEHEDSDNLTSVATFNPKCPSKNGSILKKIKANGLHTIEMHPLDKCHVSLEEKNDGYDNTSELLSSPSLPKEFDSDNVVSALLASWLRLMCLTRKNFLRLRRSIFMMFFAILIPAGEIVIFFLCVASKPFDLNVAVVNMDEDINKYGDYFLNALGNRTVNQIKFDNLTKAYESVKRGESWAALHIEPEFSTCVVDRILEGGNAFNDTLDCSMVKLYLDNSNYVITATLYFDILTTYLTFSKQLLGTFGKSTLLAESPVKIEDYIYGSASTTTIEFMAPGVIVAITYIISIAVTAISIIEEKKIGLFERTFVAGATTSEVLMSQFFVLLMIVLVQNILMLLCAFFVFSIPYNGSLLWITFGTMVVGVAGIAYGFLVSTVTDELSTAVVLAVGSFFPTIFLSAIIWPVEAMSHYLRYFSYILPLTKMIESMRSMIIRGWSVTDYNIWDGFLICTAWTIVTMVLSTIVLKLKK